MDKEIFNNAFSRAVTLMNDERFNAIVESKSREKSKMGNRGGGSSLAHLEAQAFGQTYSTPSTIQQEQYIPQQIPMSGKSAASVLPQAIRESFNAIPLQQIDTPSINPLDDVQAIKENALKRQSINETPQQVYVQNSGINYEIIKALIDESISRHLNEIKQTLITESKNDLKGLRLTEGNKIMLVDKKGNIYEGKLELKKKKE